MTTSRAIDDLLEQALEHNKQGALQKAAELYEKALGQEPDNTQALFGLGVVLSGVNKYESAREKFEKARSLGLENERVYTRLAVCADKLGDKDLAVDYFRKAIAINDQHFPAYMKLAVLLNNAGDFLAVEELCEKAMTVRDDRVRMYRLYADALRANGKRDQAEVVLKQAIEKQVMEPQSRCNLASFFAEQGRREEAVIQIEKALLSAPEKVPFYTLLTTVKTYDSIDHPHITKMKALLEKPDLLFHNEIRLYFALGNACESAGAYKDAFDFFQKGNALMSGAVTPYSLANTAQYFSDIKARFSKAHVCTSEENEKDIFQPVFIVGMPRSGAIEVEKMLAKEGAACLVGSLNLIAKIAVHEKSSFSESDIKAAVSFYKEGVEKVGGDKAFVIDRNPLNFLNIGLIKTIFPQAKIIHCQRDPRDVAVSVLKHNLGTQASFAYDQNNVAHYYGLYHDLMKYWRELFPDDIFDLSYEGLIRNQSEVSSKLLSYCGIESSGAASSACDLDDGELGIWAHYEDFLHPAVNNLRSFIED